MNTLFEIEETKTPQIRCKDCCYSERWQCGTKVIMYCNKIKSNRTENGKKKIKAKELHSCELFKQIEE